MTITKEELTNILSEIKDGDKVLEYISELEAHLEHHHNYESCDCDCDDEVQDWEEIQTGYKSKITVSEWEDLLKDETIFNQDSLIVLKRMRHVAAPTDSSALAVMFGYGALYYSFEMDKLETRIADRLNLDISEMDKWSILFNGWRQKYSTDRIYALIPELYEAIGNVDLSKIPLRTNDEQ